MAETIDVDYLVVGAGAMGMAFVDTLVSDSKKTIALVDRYSKPGGHWTTVYPYVRLHQPSVGYGVNSRRLGEDKIDKVGWNQGLFELASGDEVCGYYNIIMQQTFLPSGRVQYFPKHEYSGNGEFKSMVTGKVYRVSDSARIVDATYMKVEVPSMRQPPYEVWNGVDLGTSSVHKLPELQSANLDVVTPNNLPKLTRPYAAYTVVGGGKTGYDACLWLMQQGIDSKSIKMIVPRDNWLLDRANFQPGHTGDFPPGASMSAVNESIAAATSPEDLLLQLEKRGGLMRLDKNVVPEMYHCSTVTKKELDAMKSLGEIVRLGLVQSIGKDEVKLSKGSYKPDPDTLYIDCSAGSIPKRPAVPVFNGRNITLQPVRYCQQVFSAAFIGHAEAAYEDEKTKNELCVPIPHPDVPGDYVRITLQTYRNALNWAIQPKTAAWMQNARLDWFRHLMPPMPEDPEKLKEAQGALFKGMQGLIAKLESLMEQIPKSNNAWEGATVVKAQM